MIICSAQYKKVFISLKVLLMSVSIFCQQEQMYFQSIRQGLPNQLVRCVLKDSKGFIWFGTNNGLTRYDGLNFVVYESQQNDTNSLTYNSIHAIIEDSNKNIWIATSKGLNRYNRDQDNFIRISNTQNFVITAISRDKDNNIWMGTIGNGILKYNMLNAKIEHFFPKDTNINTINSNHITSMVADNKNRLWIGSWNGIYVLNINDMKLRHLFNIPNNPNSLNDNYVNALSIDKNETLWVGTLYGGLNRLSLNDGREAFKHYINIDSNTAIQGILSLFADKHNNIWIGTENGGLLRLNTISNKFKQYLREEGFPYSLNSNTIRSVYVDDLNILWIGTMDKGVNWVDDRYNKFELYQKNAYLKNTLCGEDVRCFAEDKQANVWIATYDGICKFNVKNRKFSQVITKGKDGLTTNYATSLIFDPDGNLWVGTFGHGIDLFNKNLVKIANFKINGLQKVGENKIIVVYVDKKANIWAGTAGSGLFRFNKSTNSFIQIFDKSKGVGPNDFGYVNSIFEDSYNNLWVGTAYKLFCLKRLGRNNYSYDIFESSNCAGGLPSNYITSIFEDHRKNLWIGSLDQGLLLYNREKKSFTSFQKKDYLPSNSIYGILEDNKNNLWISTNKGLARFDLSNIKSRNYTTKDGLVSDEFNEYNCCLRTKNGELFFGSNDGFNTFNPDKLFDNSIAEPTIITDFKLFNQSVKVGVKGSPLLKNITETKKIILNYTQSSFTIEFVALNYIQGSKSQYSYLMKGVDNKWTVVNNINSASYSYLRPGKYLFEVKGSNNDGVWNDTPARLEIVILPPFWDTSWAYLIYFLLFLTVMYVIVYLKVTRAKQIHLLEINQMKLRFFANISHELRTPLSLIISPLESILVYAKENKEITKQLELIYKNSNRLFRLVNEIMDFSKAAENKLSISVQCGDIVKFTQELSNFFTDEALRRQITYKFEANPISIETWFDHDKYEKIILNLLSNAFKFTPDDGVISINIEKLNRDILLKEKKFNIHKVLSKEFLKICIIDNGKEIPIAELTKIFERFYQGSSEDYTCQGGTGIGLSLTKTLVELHHGKIFATSEKGKETCFTILMPIGNENFKKSEITMEPIYISSNINKYRLFEEVPPKPKSELPKNAPTILLVEDNIELRRYILSSFSDTYKIIEAEDGKIGYNLAIENVPDIVISDIIMPFVSGIELCKQIKENVLTSHIPIILLTAKITLEDNIKGVETGADAYITKPFNIKYLEVVIKQLIENRKKLFRRFSQDAYIMPKEMSTNLLDQEFLTNIIKYVEENITRAELSVEDLASHLLMSPGHTWRKVNSLTGMATNEFIRTIRLKKAVELMEERNYNISEIAYRVGFSSHAYFSKCFREQYGKSPSVFLSNNSLNKHIEPISFKL
jgi:ligand-binding sensor domain-containing protein/signal transduction histidine kinase/DNA-binding response OmpR family regulator